MKWSDKILNILTGQPQISKTWSQPAFSLLWRKELVKRWRSDYHVATLYKIFSHNIREVSKTKGNV